MRYEVISKARMKTPLTKWTYDSGEQKWQFYDTAKKEGQHFNNEEDALEAYLTPIHQ